MLTAPGGAPLCLSSYDGFPELRAELFESPREQPGALPVPGPSRSAPSSPAPRRTKQVTSRWASQRQMAQAKGCCFSFFTCKMGIVVLIRWLGGFSMASP